MNQINVGLGLFSLITIFNAVLWIVGFACLIQLFRFLTKGIKALDIFIKKQSNAQIETKSSQND